MTDCPYHPRRLAARSPERLAVQASDGTRLNVWHWPGPAQATPCLLLHGFTNDGRLWDPLSQALAQHRSVYALDFRGHGDSARAAQESYRHDRLVQDVADAVQALGLQRIVLIGHSLGARIGLLFSHADTAAVEAMAIFDTGPEVRAAGVAKVRRDAEAMPTVFDSPEAYAAWLSRVYAFASGEAIGHIARHGLCHEGNQWRVKTDPAFTRALWQPNSQHGDSRDLVAPLHTQLWTAVKAFSAPVLLLRGQISAILSRETAAHMCDSFAGPATLVTIPRAGHALMTDNPTACIEAVLAFLARY